MGLTSSEIFFKNLQKMAPVQTEVLRPKFLNVGSKSTIEKLEYGLEYASNEWLFVIYPA